MTRVDFILANLFRKRTRTVLTLLSVTTAFLLFGLLQAVNVLFSAGADFVGAARIVTQSRVSFTQSLPLSQLPRIEATPGVAQVTWIQWFGGIYQEPSNFFPQFATDPLRLKAVYPEFVMPEAAWEAFRTTRTGAIVGARTAERFGWKVGDKIPLQSTIWPQQNGDKTWTFDLVGIFDGKDEEWQRNAVEMYLNFDYFNEARQFGRGLAGIYVIRLAESADPSTVSARIDALFENTPDETKTQSERDFNVGFFKQIGDIGLLVRWILLAVFFTLLMVVGNTIAQSVRERVPELAVLKTLGFSDRAVMAFVLIETLLLVGIGGLLGLGLATLLSLGLGDGGGPPIRVDGRVWAAGSLAILATTLLTGTLPALRAMRLRIVDALAGR